MTKPTKLHVRPTKSQISLGICPVWSESLLSAWRKLRSLATHWAQAKTLIRLGGCPGWSEFSLDAHAILLVLSWGGSFFNHVPATDSTCTCDFFHQYSLPCKHIFAVWKKKEMNLFEEQLVSQRLTKARYLGILNQTATENQLQTTSSGNGSFRPLSRSPWVVSPWVVSPPSRFALHYVSRFALLPWVVSPTIWWVVSPTF